MDLPDCTDYDEKKDLENAMFSKQYNIYYRLYFLSGHIGYYRIYGFGINHSIQPIFEFYFSQINFLKRFLFYF